MLSGVVEWKDIKGEGGGDRPASSQSQKASAP